MTKENQTAPGDTLDRRRLLSEREVEAAYAIPRRTLQGWRSRGGGPKFLKLTSIGGAGAGRTVRYRSIDIEKFLIDCERHSTGDPGPADAA